MHNFKELKVWQESMKLAKAIFMATKQFPAEEKYGMVSQLQRAIVSIPSNIAEGTSRTSAKEFNHFLEIALGSAFELETQLLLSLDFEYISLQQSELLIPTANIIQKMLFGLKNKVNQSQ